MLFATGLVAGGSIAGLLIVLTVQMAERAGISFAHFGETLQGMLGDPANTLVALGAFAALCTLLVRRALRHLEL
jgi:hypothetical protein